uniref:Uncharacterized protein n=1 Tax=Oryza punctata TaxID=4537 RepID=A0A0E0KBG0_ORYPU
MTTKISDLGLNGLDQRGSLLRRHNTSTTSKSSSMHQFEFHTLDWLINRALKLRAEELLPDVEEKLGLTNERKQIPDKTSPVPVGERDESERGCGCSPGSPPLPSPPLLCSPNGYHRPSGPPLFSRDSPWRKERRRRRDGRFFPSMKSTRS